MGSIGNLEVRWGLLYGLLKLQKQVIGVLKRIGEVIKLEANVQAAQPRETNTDEPKGRLA